MSKRVAILTPDPGDEGFHSRWRDPLACNRAPLERAGISVEERSWVDPIRPDEFDLVLPLLTWGYHRAGEQWHAAVARWEADGLPVQNPPSVLHWNSDKRYLGRLAGVGAPVVPTLYSDRLSEEVLQEAATDFGTDRLVAKPGFRPRPGRRSAGRREPPSKAGRRDRRWSSLTCRRSRPRASSP